MRHTAKSVHELIQRYQTLCLGLADIPTKQDIEDIGLREALRRILDAPDSLYRTPDRGWFETVLGVRLEEEESE